MSICEKHCVRYDMCSDCVSELISENESLKKKVLELEDRCALAESISKEHHDAIGKYLSLNKEFVRQQRELNTFKRAVNHVVPMGKTKSSYTCGGWSMVHADRLFELIMLEKSISSKT